MKNIYFFYLLFFLSFQINSQENTAFSLSTKIIQELNLTDVFYYTSLEQAIERYPAPINIEASKYTNRKNHNLFDYYYVFNYNNYELSLFKGASSERYYLNAIIINVSENQFVNSLLPYKTFDLYKTNVSFGKIVFIDENKLVYEIRENRTYFNLGFENGSIKKVAIAFHVEQGELYAMGQRLRYKSFEKWYCMFMEIKYKE